ncbi:MAG: Apre_1838 family putative sactipeptide bacteriocin [Finegoldia magna]|nr:Apre_1838 family putative sactipeptide bacteriocin [Finegoldia magna]
MKLVNPLGRKPSEVFDNGGATPMACMCSGEKAYTTARGTDKCFKCGCSCSSTKYSANNSKKSFWTIRGSGDIE